MASNEESHQEQEEVTKVEVEEKHVTKVEVKGKLVENELNARHNGYEWVYILLTFWGLHRMLRYNSIPTMRGKGNGLKNLCDNQVQVIYWFWSQVGTLCPVHWLHLVVEVYLLFYFNHLYLFLTMYRTPKAASVHGWYSCITAFWCGPQTVNKCNIFM